MSAPSSGEAPSSRAAPSSGMPSLGAGRGGRGAALQAAIQAQQRRPGQEQGQNVAKTLAGPDTSPTVPTGRAAMLAALLKKSQHVGRGEGRSLFKQPPASPVAGSQTVPKAAMGRAALLKLAASRGNQAKPGAETVEKMQSTVSLVPSQEMSQMSLHEKSPLASQRGISGKKIPLVTNYIKLHVAPGKGIYEYEVKFSPSVDSKNMRLRMLREHVEVIGPTRTFDGAKLYLPFELKNNNTVLSCTHPSDGSLVTMSINFKHSKQQGDLIHFYNILFRRIMSILKMVPMGRNSYSPRDAVPIPAHKLEVWPGYVTAVSEVEDGIMLCCDVSHRVLRKQTVLEIMQDFVHRSPKNYHGLMMKAIVGCSVLTRYNNKTYRVDDIDMQQSPKSTFQNHLGEEISFIDYYKKNYDITIEDDGQPLLLHRVRKKLQEEKESTKLICLVPELCFTTGLTDEMRSDYRVMKDIAVYTRLTPNQRQSSYRKFIQNILENEHAKALLANWGLCIDEDILHLQGRVLSPEEINLRNTTFQNRGNDWGSYVTRNRALSTVDLKQWVVLYTNRDKEVTQDFVHMMQKVTPVMGIEVKQPKMIMITDDRNETLMRSLEQAINPTVQCMVIIAHTQREDRYSAIKKLCCKEKPVPSQVINSRTISKPMKLRSVVQKIALQINCKLGGELWAVQMPFKDVMVCGIDVYHDISGGRSVAGFVASLNVYMTRWFSKPCFQVHGHELVDGLKVCLIAALRKYYDVNHMYPVHVILFRDGVSDGELNALAKYEVEQLATAFNYFKNYNPKLSVVVVQKRINTRIFANLNDKYKMDLENPPPGTILDHTVTRSNWYDFFLISQYVTQGTVSPTHYIVVHNSGNISPDMMQKLAYKLTHLYYNWPGTVRVPAPCQYAHKLAQLVGQNIHKEPSEMLSDRLYFL